LLVLWPLPPLHPQTAATSTRSEGFDRDFRFSNKRTTWSCLLAWKDLTVHASHMGSNKSKAKKVNESLEFKIVILGNGGVGKSALTIRFVQSEFLATYRPTIEDTYRKRIQLDGKSSVLLDILDTAGQEDYAALREVYIRGGEGFVIVYSITDRKSFQEACDYRERILRVKETSNVPMILVGNKVDLEDQRTVKREEAEYFAKTFGLPFLETSAQSGTNCEELFQILGKAVKAAQSTEKS